MPVTNYDIIYFPSHTKQQRLLCSYLALVSPVICLMVLPPFPMMAPTTSLGTSILQKEHTKDTISEERLLIKLRVPACKSVLSGDSWVLRSSYKKLE